MKKLIRYTVILLIAIVCILYRKDIAKYLTGNHTIQRLTSKVTGNHEPEQNVPDHGNHYYAYSTLTDSGKLIYNQMTECLLNFTQKTSLSTTSEDEIDIVFQCIMCDHPEIFWSNAYELNIYNIPGADSEYEFCPQYTLTKEQVSERQKEIEQYISDCFGGMPQSGTDYEKARYLFEYIILSTDYDSSSPDNQNICSVFIDHKSVCMGYSKAYSYLLQQAGIESTVVAGLSRQESHAWNLVKLDGSYCYIDATWGDPTFHSDNILTDSYIDYVFFGITTEELLKSHTLDNTFPVPECTDNSNNYFRREGLYLEQFEKNIVSKMIEQQFEKNSFVSIQASDKQVYEKLYTYLIEQLNISDFITGNKVNYTENTDYYTLTIFKS